MSIKTTFQELGAVDGLLYMLDRLLNRLSRGRAGLWKYYIVAQPIGYGDGPRLRPDSATVLVRVRAEDPLAAAFPRPAEIIARRYAGGAACTTALVRGVFAGFIWIQRRSYEEDEVRCLYVLEQPERMVWDFDVYVEPPFRVGRTMARLWQHVDAGLAAEGVRWSFSRISAFNRKSLASHARLGIVRCASASFLRLGPVQVAVLPRRPFLHVSVRDAGRPVLRLRAPA